MQPPRWDVTELSGVAAEVERETDALLRDCEAFAERARPRLATLTAAGWAAALDQLGALRVRQQRLDTATSLALAIAESDAVARDRRAVVEDALEASDDRLRAVELAWAALDDAAAGALLAAPDLAPHRHFLAGARRHRPHLLPEAVERALAASAPAAESAWLALYDHLRTGIGAEAALSALRDPSGDVRAAALRDLEDALEAPREVLAHCYDTLVAHRLAVASLRGLLPARAARDLDNELPAAAVDGMLDAIDARGDVAHAWFARKAALLGRARLPAADERAPAGAARPVPYAAAARAAAEALSGLSGDAGLVARDVLECGRVDAEPRPGKQGHARCVSLDPRGLPYVLINYRGRADDALTLGHELGHAVHFALAGRAQPPLAVTPPAVLSEVPSTLAELLVADRLVEAETDPAARLAVAAKRVETCVEAVFLSAALTRFEERAHALRADGHVLLPERLEQEWRARAARYHGPAFEPSPGLGRQWALVPHLMHEPFYTYAYAFATLACLALLAVRRRDPRAFAARLGAFLARGGSAGPVEQLRDLGFDPARAGAWQAGLDELARLMDELAR